MIESFDDVNNALHPQTLTDQPPLIRHTTLVIDGAPGTPALVLPIPSIVEEPAPTWHDYAARTIAAIFGIGTAVNAAVAIASLISLPLVVFIAAAFLCSASTYANYRMTNSDLTLLIKGGLLELFKKPLPKEGDIESDGSPYISHTKKVLLSIGLFLSATFGIALGALTYVSTVHLATSFVALAALPVFALPALGFVFGVATIVTLTALMTKSFASLVKEDVVANTWETYNNMFYAPVENETRSPSRIVLERSLKMVAAASLLAVGIGLILLGKIDTLANCAKGLNAIFSQVPQFTPAVAETLSFIVGQVFALAAQIPFVLKVTLPSVVWLFSPAKPSDPNKKAADSEGSFENTTLFVASVLTSGAMSAIAMQGKELDPRTILGGVGAFLDGTTANIVNALLSDNEKKKMELVKEAEDNPDSVIKIHRNNRVEVATTPTNREKFFPDGGRAQNDSSINKGQVMAPDLVRAASYAKV